MDDKELIKKPFHKPVLVQEVLEALAIKPGGLYVDVTFGGGGHTRAILQHEKTAHVLALDWDTKALEQNALPLEQEFPDRFSFVWSNFAHLEKQLKHKKISGVDGILADFGTSQHQLTGPGFSFQTDTFLDMRMSPAHQKTTAAEVLNKSTEAKLVQIFTELGQEPKARALARVILQERNKKRIQTTFQLVELVKMAGIRSNKRHIHPATRVFQALRMYVNKELENIHSFLIAATRVLNPGGRLVCITFHSLEDRPVKQYFKQLAISEPEQFRLLSDKAMDASEKELASNPSARSAKLRILERYGT